MLNERTVHQKRLTNFRLLRFVGPHQIWIELANLVKYSNLHFQLIIMWTIVSSGAFFIDSPLSSCITSYLSFTCFIWNLEFCGDCRIIQQSETCCTSISLDSFFLYSIQEEWEGTQWTTPVKYGGMPPNPWMSTIPSEEKQGLMISLYSGKNKHPSNLVLSDGLIFGPRLKIPNSQQCPTNGKDRITSGGFCGLSRWSI